MTAATAAESPFSFFELRRLTPGMDGARRAQVFRGLPEQWQEQAWAAHAEFCAARSEADWLCSRDEADSDRHREVLAGMAHDVRPPVPEQVDIPRRARTATRPRRSRDPLMDIPAEVYVPALTGRAVGAGGKVVCPFHAHGEERTPSLHVYDDGWWCFACGRGGTLIDLGAELYGLTPRGADYFEIRRRVAAALLREVDAA